jgi:hypothetical protein
MISLYSPGNPVGRLVRRNQRASTLASTPFALSSVEYRSLVIEAELRLTGNCQIITRDII